MKVLLKTISPIEVELDPDFYDYDYYMRGCQSGKSSYMGGWGYGGGERECDNILKYFGSIESVVEVGCALGNVVKAFENKGIDTLGIEYSNFCVKGSYAKYVIWGDLSKTLPIKDGRYELALCLEALEHIEDTESAVRELCRISSKWIFVTIPDDTPARINDGDASHISIFPKSYWVEQFKNNGFVLQDGSPTGFVNYTDGLALVFQKIK